MATAEAELFECERYRVLAGWSANYLLPTDRGAYRARGSTKSWNKVQEAEKALLGPGWDWEELHDGSASVLWQVAPLNCVDSDGWTYGTSFSSTFEGSASQGVASIVRWRRQVRTLTFAGGVQFLRAVGAPVPVCLHVDLEVAAAAGRHLTEGLAAASLRSAWSQPALVSLKQKLVAFFLKQPAGGSSLVRTVQGAVSDFVKAQGGVMARVGEALKGTDEAALADRLAEVEANFPQCERDAYAALALRRLCPDCCCSAAQEQHDCRYAPMACPNAGCVERISAFAMKAHDAICRFKKVLCQRCGESVQRGELQSHLAAACPEREATCAFASLGCTATLTHRQAQTHLEDCMQSHLLLTLQALQEEREASRRLGARIAELELRANATEAVLAPLAALQAQSTQLVSRLEAAEKKLAQEEKKSESSAAAKKTTDTALAAMQKDLASMKGDMKKFFDKLSEQGKLGPVVADQGRQLAANSDRIKALDHTLQALGAGARS